MGKRGYAFFHHAVDNHSWLAFSEILTDERKETVAAFWERAQAFFANAGIHVDAVMKDNGGCYRSRAFAAALGDAKHRCTRAYWPQTNGKVERFNRALAAEWAYATAYDSDKAPGGLPAVAASLPPPPPALRNRPAPFPQLVFTTSVGTTPRMGPVSVKALVLSQG